MGPSLSGLCGAVRSAAARFSALVSTWLAATASARSFRPTKYSTFDGTKMKTYHAIVASAKTAAT
jgi:hypothetical protein